MLLHPHVDNMDKSPNLSENSSIVFVKPFTWEDWYAMWRLVAYHLAEGGIIVDTADQPPPDFNLPYDESNPNYPEMDMERIDEAYLTGKGNFWIAWIDDQPVGHVGAQDCGDFIELRRMYVRAEYRQLGIGSALVQALIDHCRQQGATRIRLWTDPDGPGKFLYAKLGFQRVEPEGEERTFFRCLEGEMRMCLEL